MCLDCWEKYGSDKLDNPVVRNLLALNYEVYDQPEGDSGGGLHIVLDDWNITDENIVWCIEHGLTEVERRCADAFLAATLAERNSALYLEWTKAVEEDAAILHAVSQEAVVESPRMQWINGLLYWI